MAGPVGDRAWVDPTVDDPLVATLSEGVGGPVGTRAGRHPWWTPVRVLLALTAVCVALGMVQKGNCYEDTWQDGQARYSHMCYSDLPYLYTGRGFAELNWPYSDDDAGARPLLGDGVPRRDLLLGLGHGLGDALAQRVTRPRAPVRRADRRRSRAGRRCSARCASS